MPLLVFLLQLRIDDMKGFVATLEARFDERKQHSVLLIRTVEKRADVTFFAEH
jgi:hypothetical protein